MKKVLLMLFISLVGCYNEPHSTEDIGKCDNFHIEYLFEKDGIKMYRFFDGGRSHYFTTTGETITTQTSGKTTYEERIKIKYDSTAEQHLVH